MFALFTGSVTSTGLYSSLREIGLTIDDNLQATLSDSAKLDTALGANLSHTQTLLDTVMTSFNDKLGQFTGSSTGYIDSTISQIDSRLSEAGTNISDWNSRLDAREEFYYRQYGELQAQLIQLTYLKQTISTGYSLLG
jgi:flagellar capping protein FliD